MRFDFDPEKSARNLAKHGIDFLMAQAIWNHRDRLETPAKWVNEPRTRVLDESKESSGPRLSRCAMKTRHASSRSAGRALKKSRITKKVARRPLARATRPGRQVQRVNVDFPLDFLRAIDADARRIGVTRQAWIKMQLAARLAGQDGRPSDGDR